MSGRNPAAVLFDLTGSAYAVGGNPLHATGSVGISEQVRVTTTGSLPVVVQALPNVSGAVHVTNALLNVTGTVGIGGPVAAQVQNQVAVTVTSSLPVNVGNFPTNQQVWTAGPVGVSGTVGVFTQGPQNVSGTVYVTTTGSFPVVIQGQPVQVTGSVGIGGPISAQVTGSVQVLNQITVTATSSLPVTVGNVVQVTGTVGVGGPFNVTGSVGISNLPPVQQVTGSVSVFTQGAQLISGTVNLGNWPPIIGVSGSTTLRVWDPGTKDVSGSVRVFTQGPQAVSGSVSVYTQGAQFISGTVTAQVTGTVNLDRGNSTAVPLFISGTVGVGGPFSVTGSVRVENQLFVTTTGSLPITGTVGITTVVTVTGRSTSGSVQSSNPILIAGIDPSGSVRIPLHDYDGSAFVRQCEEATFVCTVTSVAIGNNKSMLSILNDSATKAIRIREIWIMNVQTTAVTGIAGIFELRRITGHSAGTLVTAIEKMDTDDVLDTNVTVRTNGTIAGESATLLWRNLWSTDEWGPGTLDQEGHDHGFQNAHPVYVRRDPNVKPLTLWPGQGLSVKHAVNSTNGSFDVFIVFTQVP